MCSSFKQYKESGVQLSTTPIHQVCIMHCFGFWIALDYRNVSNMKPTLSLYSKQKQSVFFLWFACACVYACLCVNMFL